MNGMKSFGLMAIMTLLFMVVGNAIGGQSGMLAALAMAGVTNFVGYFFSHKLVLKAYKAQPLDPNHRIMQMVKSLAENARMPMPKVYMINQNQPNAFATGRNPQNGVVAVTQGLVNNMSENEISGVLAHELAHIQNRDILIGTIAATMAGAISYLGYMSRFGMGNRGSGRQANPLFLILAMVLAPLAATLIRMAISRTREYKADNLGAKICGNPLHLSSALSKLESMSKQIPMRGSESTAHMFIVYPFTGSAFAKLFSTHPPISERVKRLNAMAGQ